MAEESKKVLTLEDDGPPEPPPPDPPTPIGVLIRRGVIMVFATVGLFSIFFGGGMTAAYLLTPAPPEIIRGGTLLVLPVSPQSRNADGLADGMTEVVHAALDGVPGLDVIPLSKTMTLKGDERQLEELAKEFNVRMIVQTAVKESSDNTRFDVALTIFSEDEEGKLVGGAAFSEQYRRPGAEFYGAIDEGLNAIVKGSSLELETGTTMDRPTEKADGWADSLNAGYTCLNAEDGEKQKEEMQAAAVELSAAAGGIKDWGVPYGLLAQCHLRLAEKGHAAADASNAKAAEAWGKAKELDGEIVHDERFKGLASLGAAAPE